MSRIALLGLSEELAQPLAQVLRAESHQVVRKVYVQDLQHGPAPDAVFISGDNQEFCGTIAQLRESQPGLPVVVVTRQPGTRHWLDALDAGAADYCGAPFERVQVRWIMQSVVRSDKRAAA